MHCGDLNPHYNVLDISLLQFLVYGIFGCYLRGELYQYQFAKVGILDYCLCLLPLLLVWLIAIGEKSLYSASKDRVFGREDRTQKSPIFPQNTGGDPQLHHEEVLQ